MHNPGRVLVFGPLALMLGALALSACGQKDAGALLAAPAASHDQSGYRAPPQVTAVRTQAGGGIEIDGASAPDARIGGETPDRKRYGATANKTGQFAIEMPASAEPQLIAIMEEKGGRDLQGDGWLFVPPDAPDHAVVLRAGAATRPLKSNLLSAVDFDAGGAVSLSGVTTPNGAVDASLDGAAPVHAVADAHGVWEARFVLHAGGSHQVRVTSRGQSVDHALEFGAGAPGQVFNAVREADGWRIAWKTPDGAMQSTFVFVGART